VGRIRENLKIKGRDCWTLFDSGARNSYVVRKATDGLAVVSLEEPRSFALGGKAHSITASCLVEARVEGHPVEFHANVTDEIGKDEDGKPIEMLFGAIAMQQWGIKLDLPNEKLDLTHLAHDFVEFSEV
jgi:hypothetical protein